MNKCANAVCWSSGHLWRRPSKEFRLAFHSACLIGLIAHLYVFTNLLFGYDGSIAAFTANSFVVNGRWALGFFSSFSTIYQIRVVLGLISIVMIAWTAGLTVRLLELSHPVSVLLVSALLVTFPTVADTFSFMFTADAYFASLFLNTLAVWLAKRYRFGWLAAIGLMTIACGIYQAYICYAIGLLLFDCVLSLLEEAPVGATVLRGLKYIAAIVISLALYAVIVRLLVSRHGASLTAYNGMDTMGEFNFKAMLAAIPGAYARFADYYIHWPYDLSLFRLAQFAAPLLFGGSLLYLVIVKKLYRSPLRLILGVAGVLLLPLALNFIAVLAYTAYVHFLLMSYASVLFFVFTVKAVELAAQQLVLRKARYWLVLPLVGAVCCCMIVWNNFCACNVGYHAMQTCYENTHALATRVITRLEKLEGYTPGDPIAFIGYPPTTYYGIYRRYWSPYSRLVSDMNWNLVFNKTYIMHYLGLLTPNPTAEQRAALESSVEVAALPIWPAQGCAAMIDGVAVIRMGEDFLIR